MQMIGVVIGRFSGFHEGHKFLIKTALDECSKVVVLIGSANAALSIKNPWSYKERRKEILDEFPTVECYPINDYKYDDERWIYDVNLTVNLANPDNLRITLYGHEKEDTGYLHWFPEWRYRRVESDIVGSGTITRRQMYVTNTGSLPNPVKEDFHYFENEQKLFANYPFKNTLGFMCADVVVECDRHILLTQRKNPPGRNTWALPGGFRENTETFLECALRELREETNLRVPEKVLRGSIREEKLFDAIDRGCGIPRTTMAYYIEIARDTNGELPRVRGGDDARSAKWVSISDIMSNIQLFDDHQAIISTLTRVYPVTAIFNQIYK